MQYVVPEQSVFDKLTGKYGFNLQNYYQAAVQCNKAQLKDSMPDFTKMQADGITPACYYNIKAQKAERTADCTGPDLLNCKYDYKLSDF